MEGMLLYGSLKRNFEIVGETPPQVCPNCGDSSRQLRLVSKRQVSVFGLPIWNSSGDCYLACNNCESVRKVGLIESLLDFQDIAVDPWARLLDDREQGPRLQEAALQGRHRALTAFGEMYGTVDMDRSWVRENELVILAILSREIRRSIVEGEFPLTEEMISSNADRLAKIVVQELIDAVG